MTHRVEGQFNGQGVRVGLVVSRFNETITGRLLAGAVDCLERHGCAAEHHTVVRVPGAWELPLAARRLAARGDVQVIVALGALVRGETPHFDVLASQVARGLGQVAMQADLPVIFGVLTTDTVQQAMDRAGSKAGNKGWEAALAALEMVDVFRRLG